MSHGVHKSSLLQTGSIGEFGGLLDAVSNVTSSRVTAGERKFVMRPGTRASKRHQLGGAGRLD